MPDTLPEGLPNPSYGTAEDSTARVLRAEFGDGYAQRAADGINTINREFPVVWQHLTATQADSLESFLVSKGGHTVFLYTPPRSSTQYKVTCSKWHREPVQSIYVKFTATFRREFDL